MMPVEINAADSAEILRYVRGDSIDIEVDLVGEDGEPASSDGYAAVYEAKGLTSGDDVVAAVALSETSFRFTVDKDVTEDWEDLTGVAVALVKDQERHTVWRRRIQLVQSTR